LIGAAILAGLVYARFTLFPGEARDTPAQNNPAVIETISADEHASESEDTPAASGDGPIDLRPDDQSSERAELVALLMENDLFKLIADNFEPEFNTHVDQLMALINDPEAEAKAYALSANFTANLRRTHAHHGANASYGDLINTMEARKALLMFIKETQGQTACADFAILSTRAPQLGDWNAGEFLTEVSYTTLLAIINGRKTPEPHGEITSEDVIALKDVLVALGTEEDEVQRFFEGYSETVPEACDTTLNMLDSFRLMEKNTSTRLMSTIFEEIASE